jgi:hypothetical protein
MRIQQHEAGGRAAVWIDDPELLELGWSFLVAVAGRVMAGGPLMEAVDAELGRWRDLVSSLTGTTLQAAVGLLGELAVMRAAMSMGRSTDCWVGLAGGAIDFRFGSDECEVKTTSGSRHEHIIHGTEQLQPSLGDRLYLLSLMIAPTELGSGPSIATLVAELVEMGMERETLEAAMRQRQIDITDAAALTSYVLRSEPMVIEVAGGFPALTMDAIEAAIGPQAWRIRDVSYRLDLEGFSAATEGEVISVAASVKL